MKTINLSHVKNFWFWLLMAAVTACLLASNSLYANNPATNNTAYIAQINGPIGPATADYIKRSIETSENANAQLLILQIDTPGGLDTAMRVIIKAILGSPVPIVSYVAPSGARAASAGTYILYASHIAAMAPGTNTGAATPISLDATPTPNSTSEKNKASNDKANKVKNDAVAYIQSLAKLHNRNSEWTKKAVLEGASLSADQALKLGVIDLIADDVPDLLDKINGTTLTLQGQTKTLNTAGLSLKKLEPDWRTRFLSAITNPNIAYLLLLLGIYGIFFEFANPGFVLPGVVGAIAILIALYALQLMPISYVGLSLILLGIIFLVSEAFVSSFGALGIGGLIAFTVGSIMLFDKSIPGYALSGSLLTAMVIITGLFFFVIIALAIKSRYRNVVSGQEALIGRETQISDNFADTGWIKIDGETWHAEAKVTLVTGQKVKVTHVDGLTLFIEPIED